MAEALSLGSGATATLYEAIPGEPPTAGMVKALQGRGVRVIVPITLPDLDLDWTVAPRADDPATTSGETPSAGVHTAYAPLGRDAIGEADLVLIPGLAVDQAGTRLGQGGGCYDKALPRRRPGQQVIVVLHPEEFPADALPREPHDVAVGAVLTADGLVLLDLDPRAPNESPDG